MSAVISSIWGVAAMNACQCASMRPGISTRPPPATTRVPALVSSEMGSTEMRAMVLPLTSTFEGADSAALRPSKMRTFSKSVGGPLGGGAGGATPGISMS